MSNHTVFNDGVEVHSRHLAYESEQRQLDLSGHVLDSSLCGVTSGLVVSVNATPTLINISSGSGYSKDGRYMTYAGSSAVSLATYTLNAKNYVALMYSEDYSLPEAHEATGVAQPTRATVIPRLVVLSESDWNLLPSTSSVMSASSLDKSVLLAIVTANGSGVALTSASIASPTQYNTAISISQPSIAGIVISATDQTTPTGTGTLSYTASSYELTWTSPEASAGSPVVISATGAYRILSSTSKWVDIFVTFPLLPAVDASSTLTIANLYSQTIQRFSTVDAQHRSMVGTGIPSTVNPHGMTLADIDPLASSAMQVHQLIQHANGIVVGSTSLALRCAVDNSTSPDFVVVDPFDIGDLAYINGLNINAINGSTSILFTDGTAFSSLYSLYITQTGVLNKHIRATYDPSASVHISTNAQLIDCSDDIPNGMSYDINWDTSNRLRFNNGQWISMPSTDSRVRLYSRNGISWVELFVKAGVVAPVSIETLPITFVSPLNQISNLQLAMVYWSGAASGNLGYGFGTLPINIRNRVVDKRTYGTLDIGNQATESAIQSRTAAKLTLESGIVPVVSHAQFVSNAYTERMAIVDQFSCSTVSAGEVIINGGSIFIAGRHYFIRQTTVATVSSKTTYIYVNELGQIAFDTTSWNDIVAHGATIVKLWEIKVSGGGTELWRIDHRTYGASYRKNVPFGVPGLGNYGQLVLTPKPSESSSVPGQTAATIIGGAGYSSTGAVSDGGIALALLGGQGGTGTGVYSTGGTGLAVQGGEAGNGSGGTNDGGVGISVRGGQGHAGGIGGTAIVARGNWGDAGDGKAAEFFSDSADAVEITSTGGNAINVLDGDISIQNTDNYKYDGYVSNIVYVDPAEFVRITGGATIGEQTDAGDDQSKAIWFNAGSTCVLTARIRVPKHAQIWDIDFHFGNADGTARNFTGSILAQKYSASYGTTVVTKFTETFSVATGAAWYAAASTFTPFNMVDIDTGASAYITIKITMPAYTTTFRGARITYNISTVSPLDW